MLLCTGPIEGHSRSVQLSPEEIIQAQVHVKVNKEECFSWARSQSLKLEGGNKMMRNWGKRLLFWVFSCDGKAILHNNNQTDFSPHSFYKFTIFALESAKNKNKNPTYNEALALKVYSVRNLSIKRFTFVVLNYYEELKNQPINAKRCFNFPFACLCPCYHQGSGSR